MDTILDPREVQDELDKAARDAKLGTADVRAGRFVHQDAMALCQAGADAPGRARTRKSERDPPAK